MKSANQFIYISHLLIISSLTILTISLPHLPSHTIIHAPPFFLLLHRSSLTHTSPPPISPFPPQTKEGFHKNLLFFHLKCIPVVSGSTTPLPKLGAYMDALLFTDCQSCQTAPLTHQTWNLTLMYIAHECVSGVPGSATSSPSLDPTMDT